MDQEDQDRFLQNVEWFNRFFEDVQQVFEKTARLLANRRELQAPSYYYGKSNNVPSIPPFYMMGVGGDGFAVQMFAIVDRSLLEGEAAFTPVPSLVMIVHSREDRVLWPSQVGLRIIENDRISIAGDEDGVLRGEIQDDPPNRFVAFQVLFDRLTDTNEVSSVIEEVIIKQAESFFEDG